MGKGPIGVTCPQDSVKAATPDPAGLPPVPVGGSGVWVIHTASEVGYGEGFAGHAHRHVDNGWLPSVKFLVEEVGIDEVAPHCLSLRATWHRGSPQPEVGPGSGSGARSSPSG